jgi:transcriptional regulator with XRE-family HTH domain
MIFEGFQILGSLLLYPENISDGRNPMESADSKDPIPYHRFGELIRRGIRTIAARQSWSMMEGHEKIANELELSADAIRRWEQGRHKPGTEAAMMRLVELGVAWGELDQEWARETLSEYGFPDVDERMANLFEQEVVEEYEREDKNM